jgi:hypothetical protein
LPKAKKRIKAVRKLAYGGIILSTLLALVYGGVTYFSIYVQQKNIQEQEIANIDLCKDEVLSLQNKAYAANNQYSKELTAEELFQTGANQDNCEKNTEKAINEARFGLNEALNRAQLRCISAAQDVYNNFVKNNHTGTSRGEDGEVLYQMPEAQWDYVDNKLKSDKDICQQEFAPQS